MSWEGGGGCEFDDVGVDRSGSRHYLTLPLLFFFEKISYKILIRNL